MINPELPVVLVDMDGVLANFDAELLSRVALRYPHIPHLEPEKSTFFYTHENFDPEHQDLVHKLCLEEGFITSLPMIPGALDGWERIINAGYRPRICSSPLPTAHCEIEKRDWLRQHFVPRFGAWVVDTAIITRHKQLVDGVALIDDRPPPLRDSDEATWEHIIFDRACNRGADTAEYIRITNWADPELPEKLALAEERAKKRLARRALG